MSASTILPDALRYAREGISIICIGQNKRPLDKWTASQHEALPPEVLEKQLSRPQVLGYAAVTGEVSGGLVCYDLDPDKKREALTPVDPEQLLSEFLEAVSGIVDTSTLPIFQTPSGGYHIYIRTAEPGGNSKLAGVPANNRQGVHFILETRGTGGYALLPGSQHPSGGAYIRLQGDLTDAPMLTSEEHEAFLSAARSLDRMPLKAEEERRLVKDYERRQGGTSEVIEAFNERYSPADILERNGYELRQGKFLAPDSSSRNPGVSLLGDGELIYSHHSDLLGDGHAHDAFDVFAILEHDSDKKKAFKEAARELGVWEENTPTRRPAPAASVEGDAAPPDLTQYQRTDYGRAESLHALFGHAFRYCAGLGYLVWDGRRWLIDEDDQAMRRLALETGREVYRQAGQFQGDKREMWAKHSLTYERSAAIKSAVELARTIPGVAVGVDELDADPMLLNVANGTLDLETGKLKPHDPADLITKLAPVMFDDAATCPTWDAFQKTICAGDSDLIAFKQRAWGYTFTGDTSEDCLFIPYGSGANGKSTEVDTMNRMLADYANTAQFESFAVKKNEGVRDDLADLKGARFVSASEGEHQQRLAEGQVKALTGGDEIKARHLYGRYFRFKPTFKLWLATNHKPIIRGTDHGIWRRIRLLPYTYTVPPKERDRGLREKLSAEKSGILNWVLEGVRLWREVGLGGSEAVATATEEYRQESDVLAEFIAARCVTGELYSVKAADIHKAYAEWCEEAGEEAISRTTFGKMLNDRGFGKQQARVDGKNTKLRVGIGLKDDAEGGGVTS